MERKIDKRRRELIGKKFDRLLVKSFNRCDNGHLVWNCECECGGIVEVPTYSLRNRHTKSCGCLFLENIRKRPYEGIYNRVVRGSKCREIKVELTYEEFLKFTEIKECHYCNRVIKWCEFQNNGQTEGLGYNLDRKDVHGSYSNENCVVCCGPCNKGRNKFFTYQQWYKMTEPYRTGELSL